MSRILDTAGYGLLPWSKQGWGLTTFISYSSMLKTLGVGWTRLYFIWIFFFSFWFLIYISFKYCYIYIYIILFSTIVSTVDRCPTWYKIVSFFLEFLVHWSGDKIWLVAIIHALYSVNACIFNGLSKSSL